MFSGRLLKTSAWTPTLVNGFDQPGRHAIQSATGSNNLRPDRNRYANRLFGSVQDVCPVLTDCQRVPDDEDAQTIVR
jgi:hypothetical protein